MQFLRTLFWVVIAVIAVIFATRNWTPVSLNLWGGIVVDVKLPVLMLLAFLVGLVPTFLVYRATRWRMQRRLDAADRALTELRPAPVAVPSAAAPSAADDVNLVAMPATTASPITPAPPVLP